MHDNTDDKKPAPPKKKRHHRRAVVVKQHRRQCPAEAGRPHKLAYDKESPDETRPATGIEHPILVLDIDGTMVGGVNAMAAHKDIADRYSRVHATTATNTMRSQVSWILARGTIRPGLREWCAAMQQRRGAKLFVYTASEDGWASFIVPLLEKHMGIRFERPIFARSKCIPAAGGMFKKSLMRIAPSVGRTLRLSASECLRRMYLIDNTPSILADCHDRIVHCPTYEFMEWYDVLRMLDEKFVRSHFRGISGILARVGFFQMASQSSSVQPPFESYEAFASAYYSTLARHVSTFAASNEKARLHDRFWATLRFLPAF